MEQAKQQNAYVVFDALKANPGSSFSQLRELLPNMAAGSVSGCLVKLRKGFKGMRVIAEGPPMGMTYTASERSVPVTSSKPRRKARRTNGSANDLLICIPLGDNRTETVTMTGAHRIWSQLNGLFGKGK